MAPGSVTISHPSGESGDTESIKEKELEEGEIEEDESADEGLQLSRPLPPSSDLMKTPRRKRRRKAALKKSNNVFKKRKLNHASSFEQTMKASLDGGTVQTNGNELFDQSKHPIIRNNCTPFLNPDEYPSRNRSDFHDDIVCSKNYNIYKTFYLGIKSGKCKQKKLCSKKKRLGNSLSKNDSFSSLLKMKLCKSYPENKNNKCSHMHSQFPCKFSNTEVRCNTGDHRKFGLEVFAESLTDPKKIYRNSPHLTGDEETEVLNTKKIPSLLEIEVSIPQQLLANGSNITANSEQSTPSKYHTTRVKGTRPCTLMPSSLKKNKFPIFQQRDITSFTASSDPNYDEMRQIVSGKKEELSNGKKQPTIFSKQNDTGGCVYDRISAVSSLSSMSCTKKSQTETTHDREIIVPQNLPKKQQELFLRIQRRQRKPLDRRNRDLGEQDKARNEEDKKEKVDEQTLYSSDDDDDSSIVSVLKNLPKQQSFPKKASISSISTPIFRMASSSSMTQSGDKFLSNIRDSSSKNVANSTAKSVPSPKICEHFYSMTQTQSKEPQWSLQNPYQSSISSAISSVDISEHKTQTPVSTKSSSNGTGTYCRSLGNISAYKAAIESYAGGRILDFRNAPNVQQNISLQSKIKRDVDLQQNSIPLSSLFSTFNGNKIYKDAAPSKGVDLKGIAELPFGPTSLHPTIEINASLNSHAPIPYKLIPITVSPSDNSGLKAYAQTSRDPRLHRPSSTFNGINMNVVLGCLSKIKNLQSINSRQK